MRLRAGPIVAGALALTAAPSGVRAELRYEAPGDCPDQAAFSAAFARRSERSLPPATRVTIVGEERAYRGVIEVEGQERVLLLDRCDELVEALALSLALQLGKRPDDRKPEPSPAKNGARDGVSPLPTAQVPPGQGPPAITDGPAPTPAPNMSPPVAQPPEDDETPWRVEAGFSLQARWGRGRVARAEPS
ncbi:MAG: hypothetical protein KC731_40665, partial [Myxococcales bacterium]|nr:hypothetical protein [Myxococcales bacterium]